MKVRKPAKPFTLSAPQRRALAGTAPDSLAQLLKDLLDAFAEEAAYHAMESAEWGDDNWTEVAWDVHLFRVRALRMTGLCLPMPTDVIDPRMDQALAAVAADPAVVAVFGPPEPAS